MKATILPSVNMILRPLALCALATLLCSCAATSVKNTWKSPDCQQPVGKIAVLAIDDRGLLRQGFENRFVRYLANAGASAVVTFDLLSLPQIKEDKRAAADRFRASGAEALLILRLVDVGSSYRESRAGTERYAPMITGVDSMGWYDYYSVGFMDMSSTYGNLTQTVSLETSLYDLKTEKRLWSGLTRTVVKENMDRVGEMDPLVEKIVAAMQKDGVIR
jgi:hypothetical protein